MDKNETIFGCAECDCHKGGIYCNWIATTPQEYRKRIEQLERELSLQNRLMQDAHDGWKIATDQLTAEKALADRLHTYLLNLSYGYNASNMRLEANEGVATYRKARGL